MSLDTYRSPSDAFAATAARRPDGPFLLAPASAGLSYAPEGFRIEYGAFKTEVDRLRVEYAAAGYGRGARVALLLENVPVPKVEELSPELEIYAFCNLRVLDQRYILIMISKASQISDSRPLSKIKVEVARALKGRRVK